MLNTKTSHRVVLSDGVLGEQCERHHRQASYRCEEVSGIQQVGSFC